MASLSLKGSSLTLSTLPHIIFDRRYKAQIKANRFATGEDFWQAVQASARSMSASIDTSKVESILQAIKINSFDVERPMIERLYRPMNISTANIDKLMGEGRRHMPVTPVDVTVYESKLGPRSSAFTEPRLSVHPTDDSGSTRMCSSQDSADVYSILSGAESEAARPLFELLCTRSSILQREETSRLLSMLPPRVLTEGLELAFSTLRCGWALASLYAEVKDLRPCVLLVQTLPQLRTRRTSESVPSSPRGASDIDHPPPSPRDPDPTKLHPPPAGESADDEEDDDRPSFSDEDRGVVLGVYLPGPLSPPSTAFRGDSEAFVFRLTEGIPHPAAKDAPGIGKGAKFAAALGPNGKQRVGGPPLSEAALNQFAVCAGSYMSFGASAKYATNALRIDEELRWAASGPSDTYTSPPLLLEEECDANARAGLTMVPMKRNSFTSFGPALRRSRSHSGSAQGELGISGERAGGALDLLAGELSASEVDRRAGIKQIEVWCGRKSFQAAGKHKVGTAPGGSSLGGRS
jgi:hypothetical protein